ncbi:hypothetical protein LRS03_26155 [Rhizobacter sp. J219]|jgi:hypothetical protein|uniref:hypothetical protein n=1 Tax=Rhizobacter sp. J219 TaxID=2898430 RepID=UPI002151DBD4|nr:hypothetical protein [Rhizobacter sp. J219]MCR5886147.1 hypothetical protein [Rhizobacter sp. J219]
MTSTFASQLPRVALAAALFACWVPVQAADVKAAPAAASQPKAKKSPTKKATAKPAAGADANTTSNNPVGKADDGSNLLGGKKPSGPRKPELQQAGATATSK